MSEISNIFKQIHRKEQHTIPALRISAAGEFFGRDCTELGKRMIRMRVNHRIYMQKRHWVLQGSYRTFPPATYPGGSNWLAEWAIAFNWSSFLLFMLAITSLGEITKSADIFNPTLVTKSSVAYARHWPATAFPSEFFVSEIWWIVFTEGKGKEGNFVLLMSGFLADFKVGRRGHYFNWKLTWHSRYFLHLKSESEPGPGSEFLGFGWPIALSKKTLLLKKAVKRKSRNIPW